jgi:hypothetical protein
MPRFQRSEFSVRRGIPANLKLVAAAIVVMLIVIRACAHRADSQAVHIGPVTIEDATVVSTELTFPIQNTSKKRFERKRILIKLYLQDGTMFKDKLTFIDIQPNSNKTYRFVIEKYDRALRPDEKITAASVEFYRGAFQ